jgi:hypothetical protein
MRLNILEVIMSTKKIKNFWPHPNNPYFDKLSTSLLHMGKGE